MPPNSAVSSKPPCHVSHGRAKRKEGLLPPPVGTSDWVRFSRTSYCVDKTLILKDLIDSESTVVLFTRPRRFGKTTMLEMIRAFYEPETLVEGRGMVKTEEFFTDKKIWAAGAKYRKEQGKHPVIFLSFKDIKQTTAEEAFTRLAAVIGGEVARFADCIENGWGDEAKKRSLRRVMNREGTKDELSESLGLLSEAVHAFTQKLPVILIDEYDQPITTASTNGFYDEMCTFMRVFLSDALKDNKHCHIGIMTGVLRVAKEGILSGLNNPAVWTVFESEYSQYFGFTEEEVAEMARYYGAEDKLPEIKAWYDGYDFGGTEIYNPWSVLRYFDCHCRPDAYWLDTSSNDLITEIVQELPFDMEATLHKLMTGNPVVVPMAKELGPYKQIRDNENTLYALLVSAGYLKAVGPIDENGDCLVTIPNKELSLVFYREIVQKVRSFDKKGGISAVEDALRERDPFLFGKYLAAYLKESVSFFDTAAEGFYHGLVLGFIACFRNRFVVKSNRESGEGRYDISMRPLIEGMPGVVIELKAAEEETEDLDALAREARRQIDTREYTTEMLADFAAHGEKRDILKLAWPSTRRTSSSARICPSDPSLNMRFREDR